MNLLLVHDNFDQLIFVIAVLILSIGGAIAEKLKRKLGGPTERPPMEGELRFPKPPVTGEGPARSTAPPARPVGRTAEQGEPPASPARPRPPAGAPAAPVRRPPPPPSPWSTPRRTEPRPTTGRPQPTTPGPRRQIPPPTPAPRRVPRPVEPAIPPVAAPSVIAEQLARRAAQLGPTVQVPGPVSTAGGPPRPPLQSAAAAPAPAFGGQWLGPTSITDLQRAIVLNEILAPPLALRDMD